MTHPTLSLQVSHEQIAKLMGDARFADIRDSLEHYDIQDIEQDKHSATAQVNGYTVKVNYRLERLDGACNCEESDGFDFCEHCAALCLQLIRNNQQIASLAKGPDKSRVLAYLLSQDKQTLAKDFLSHIADDNELLERYLLRASLHQEKIDYTQLKSQLTELTRKPEKLFSQRKVKLFFDKIEAFLREINRLEEHRDPDKMLKIFEHAHQRITRLLESIDDNSEQRSDCAATLREGFQILLAELHGRDDTKAKRYFKHWLNDAFNLLGDEPAKILSEAAEEKFIALLKKCYQDKIKKSKDSKDAALEYSDKQREKILRFLLDWALAQDDQALVKDVRPHLP